MKTNLLSIILFIILSIGNAYSQTQKIDIVKSKLSWKGTPDIAGHNGTIAIKEGNVIFKNNKIVSGVFVLNMKDIVALDAKNEDYEKMIISELSNDQFFNVAKFPTAKFKITSFVNDVVIGDLTIVGITNSIQFKATTTKNGKKIVVDTEKFNIDLLRWGLKLSKWFGENKFDNSLSIQVHIETL